LTEVGSLFEEKYRILTHFPKPINAESSLKHSYCWFIYCNCQKHWSNYTCIIN